MVIRVYWASVTGNRKIEGDQTRVRYILESHKIDSVWIDITTSSAVRCRMREECSNPKALPPQILNDGVYIGDAEGINESVEVGQLMEWLRLKESEPVNNNGKNRESTSGNVELEPIAADNANCQKLVPLSLDANDNDVPKSEAIVTGKSVSAAVNAFENTDTSPKVSRKSVTLQFDNCNKAASNVNCIKIDEERRRRILGLPPIEQSDSPPDRCLQDKTNENVSSGVKQTNGEALKICEAGKTISVKTGNEAN